MVCHQTIGSLAGGIPNSSRLAGQRRLTVHAVKDIPEGEEITYHQLLLRNSHPQARSKRYCCFWEPCVDHVGSGGYGNCLLLQKRSNQTLRVCKVQKRRTEEPSEPLEIEILRDILHDHPRIVRLHEAIMHTHTMQLYFDYYPGGDLFQLNARYVEYWEPVPESFIWHCFLQLSYPLAYIHHGYDRRQVSGPPPASEWQPIVHGDVKPENLFLGPSTEDSHGYPSLVLRDFGLATINEHPVPGT